MYHATPPPAQHKHIMYRVPQ